MDEFKEQQGDAARSSAERNFVEAVRERVVLAAPALGADPTLLERLSKAYGEARRVGLQQEALLVQFLHLEAEVPGFYRQPAMSAWLARPLPSADERFEALLSLLHRKLEDKRGRQ